MHAAEVKRADLDAAIKGLTPIVRREAGKMHRTVPASVTLDELTAAGLEGAWQAARDFSGAGNLQAFACERIRQRMLDYLRTTHPAGRSGKKIVAVSDDDALELVAGEDDPAAAAELAQQFEVQMSKLPPEMRTQVQRALAGKPGAGVSAERVTAMLDGKRNKTPDSFDPDSVPVLMGLPVPKPQSKKRVNRFAKLLARLPATGACRLSKVQASSLASEAKKQGVRYALRADPQSETLRLFFREPSTEQLKGL